MIVAENALQLKSEPKLRTLVMWALTYRCNLRCQYCYLFVPANRASLQEPEASEETVKNITAALVSDENWRPEIVWLTGGEPTLRAELPWIVSSLEGANVMSVVTTNGAISESTATNLIRSRPRGIMVSLDLPEAEGNDLVRAAGTQVLSTIRRISSEKDSYTTFGLSVFFSRANVARLAQFARFLEDTGVEYLSLNPLHVPNARSAPLAVSRTESTGARFARDIDEVRRTTNLALPSNTYLNILEAHLAGTTPAVKLCPAAHEYAFIAPWGQLYPCSSEFWQRDSRLNDGPVAMDGVQQGLTELRDRLGQIRYTTGSPCFSARCLGCWKLYYDAVFDKRSH
jgi:molybdenum cofactor biosynthesis enzyme MoaA